MLWNKCFSYLIAISFLMLLLSGVADPPIAGWPFVVVMILLNGLFVICCKGWRRFLAIGFIILGICMFIRTSNYSELLNKRLEQIQASADNYSKTNAPVLNSSTNSTK
jgi:hypothetical protein